MPPRGLVLISFSYTYEDADASLLSGDTERWRAGEADRDVLTVAGNLSSGSSRIDGDGSLLLRPRLGAHTKGGGSLGSLTSLSPVSIIKEFFFLSIQMSKSAAISDLQPHIQSQLKQ